MTEINLELLIKSYKVLANINNNWPNRHTHEGQQLLCDLRNQIAIQMGKTQEEIQNEFSIPSN